MLSKKTEDKNIKNIKIKFQWGKKIRTTIDTSAPYKQKLIVKWHTII